MKIWGTQHTSVTQRWSNRDDLGARAGREALIGGMSRAALTLVTCPSHAYHMILCMPGCLGASLSCCLTAFSLPLPFCLTTALFIAFSSCLFVLSFRPVFSSCLCLLQPSRRHQPQPSRTAGPRIAESRPAGTWDLDPAGARRRIDSSCQASELFIQHPR